MSKITVCGSGVVGSSVALVLDSLEHVVTLVGARRMSDHDASTHPEFASAFPAASVIPHSITLGKRDWTIMASESVFEMLTDIPAAAVRLQRHLELFEDPDRRPERYPMRRGCVRVDDDTYPETIPKRKAAPQIHGMAFDCFFCDMPIYGPWLDEMVNRSSIQFRRETIDAHFLESTDADIIVNCLGIGAAQVFPELDAGFVYRGILLKTPFENPAQEIVSYNYTPDRTIYRNGDAATDVYFYPRTGHCLLGGTRQRGRICPDTGDFVCVDAPFEDCLEIGGVRVPRPIIELNTELIEQLTGRRIEPPFEPLVGYRHAAGSLDEPEVVIQSVRSIHSRPVIDCYGWGGAGVTLSWGAAIEVSQLISKQLSRPPFPVERLASGLLDLVRGLSRPAR